MTCVTAKYLPTLRDGRWPELASCRRAGHCTAPLAPGPLSPLGTRLAVKHRKRAKKNQQHSIPEHWWAVLQFTFEVVTVVLWGHPQSRLSLGVSLHKKLRCGGRGASKWVVAWRTQYACKYPVYSIKPSISSTSKWPWWVSKWQTQRAREENVCGIVLSLAAPFSWLVRWHSAWRVARPRAGCTWAPLPHYPGSPWPPQRWSLSTWRLPSCWNLAMPTSWLYPWWWWWRWQFSLHVWTCTAWHTTSWLRRLICGSKINVFLSSLQRNLVLYKWSYSPTCNLLEWTIGKLLFLGHIFLSFLAVDFFWTSGRSYF